MSGSQNRPHRLTHTKLFEHCTEHDSFDLYMVAGRSTGDRNPMINPTGNHNTTQ